MIVSTQETTHWITVLLNHEPLRKIHRSIFKAGELPQSVSSEEELVGFLNKIETSGARHYVLKRLAMQSQWSGQLRKLLEEREVAAKTIDAILAECERNGYINDEEWVNNFIAGQKRKRVGPRVISQKLRSKGIPPELYEPHLNDDAPSDRLQELIRSKYAKRNLSDYKEKQKVVASLVRKGYDFQDVFEAIELLKKDL